ncbi:glyoxalase [Yoonia sp. SS1-5]|uniref:Glyoxalase n=1 Tax=Yoonia rhodophyticola TaxID=3137370 RepID=A0AAN0MI33_9RHOB
MLGDLDHIQLAFPAGAESRMRAYYCDLLGMVEIAKPAALQGRGGFWTRVGALEIHFGKDPDFHRATKAHPAFRVADIDRLARLLTDAGFPVLWDTALPDVIRFFSTDPVGNRIEFISAETSRGGFLRHPA